VNLHRHAPPLRLPVARAAAATAVLMALSGCTALGPTSRVTGVQVVAAERTWGAVAASLGGRVTTVTSIISSPAADPHSYEPEAADARAFAQARVAIVNGLGYDSWASRLLAADSPPGRVTVNVGAALGLSGAANPHRWYAPADVVRVAAVITDALIRSDPRDAAYFRTRHARFLQGELGTYFRTLATIRNRHAGAPIGASESVVVPLAAALGLDVLTPARMLRAVSNGADVSSQDMTTAERQISRREIRVWVVNTQNTTPNVQILTSLARAAGIPVVTMTETPDPAGATFGTWQTRQLRALSAALDGIGGTR
jgi:zinc/manganese transport system substrate-binding protein